MDDILTYCTKKHLFIKSILICKPKEGSVKLFHNEGKLELNMKSEPP